MNRSPKTVLVDNLDDNSNQSALSRDPLDYSDDIYVKSGSYTNERKSKLSSEKALSIIVFVFVSSLFAFYFVWSFVEFLKYKYAYDDTFQYLVDFGVMLVYIITIIVIILCLFAAFRWIINKAQMSGLVRLPGGFVAHISDVASGWNRIAVRDIVTQFGTWHFDVKRVLAEQSKYRAMQYYSPSYTRQSVTKESIDAGDHSNDYINGEAIIPSMGELLDNKAFGDVVSDEDSDSDNNE